MRYVVGVKNIIYVGVGVDAESSDEAIDKVFNLLDDSDFCHEFADAVTDRLEYSQPEQFTIENDWYEDVNADDYDYLFEEEEEE